MCEWFFVRLNACVDSKMTRKLFGYHIEVIFIIFSFTVLQMRYIRKCAFLIDNLISYVN